MKLPKNYIYPAIFEYNDNETIGVYFPDLLGCVSVANNEIEALENAKEVLGFHLIGMEEDNETIPKASKLIDLKLNSNERAVLINIYMPSVRLANINKSVNRTVTLPSWLNSKAIEHKVNFSQILQEALIKHLN